MVTRPANTQRSRAQFLCTLSILIALLQVPFPTFAAPSKIASKVDTAGRVVVVAELVKLLKEALQKLGEVVVRQEHIIKAVEKLEDGSKSISQLLKERGANGMLFDVYIYYGRTAAGDVHHFGAMLPSGIGMDPADAALKSYLAEVTINNELPNYGLAQEDLPPTFTDRTFSDYSFSIWAEVDSHGELGTTLIVDPDELYAKARKRWKIFQGSLLAGSSEPTLVRLGAEGNAYRALADRFAQSAVTKHVQAELERLLNAQEDASASLAKAVQIQEKASARAKKWKDFGTVAALLGAASAAAAENSKSADAAKNYADTVHYRATLEYNNSKTGLNIFFQREFDVKAENLPSPEVLQR